MVVPEIDLLGVYQVELDGFSLQRVLWLIEFNIRSSDGYLSRTGIMNLLELRKKIIENMKKVRGGLNEQVYY